MIEEKVILSIRDATSEDLREIQKIERKSFKDPYPSFYMRALLEGLADIFLVAEIEDKIIGYVIARVEFGYVGHIISIAVDPEWRRRGVGTLLMIKVMERLKRYGCESVYLEVRTSNEPAIRMYEKLGFRIEKTLLRYYRDGEDAFVMSRQL